MKQTVVASTTTTTETPWTVLRALECRLVGRWEILEGILYLAAAPPCYPHAEVIDNLYGLLREFVRPRGLGRVLPPQTGIYINEINYLDPDLLYLRPEQLPRRAGEPHRAAALAVEVMSATSLRATRAEREARFAAAGVEELWYVSLRDRTLEARRLGPAGYETIARYREGDTVTTAVLPGLQFPLSAAWEDVPE